MSGKKSLIEAYMKQLDKKVTAKQAGQNRIEGAAIQGVRMADIPVFKPTVTIRVPERVSDGKPLDLTAGKEESAAKLPVLEKEPSGTLPAAGKIADYRDPAGMIAEAFALQEENAKAQKPLTKKEQQQAEQRKRSREKAEKAEQRQAQKSVVEQAKAQRDAERTRLGLEYATAKDPVAALPAYKAGLKAANEAYYAAVNAAAEPERFDLFVQAEGTAEAAVYDAKVVKQGEKSKNNPLNQDPKQWMKGGGMGQAEAAIEKKQTLDALDENQRTYINYLYGKYDKATADKLTETLLQNIRNAAILADNSAGAQTQNAFTAVGGNIFAAPVYAGEMVGQAAKNLATGANLPVAGYTQGSRMMSEQAARTQALLDDIENPAGEFLAQTGIGVGQNVLNTVLFGKFAPAMMGLQAAGSAGYEAAQNGATGWQQLGKGVQSAATEFLTEKISWGKLDEVLNNPGAKPVKDAVAQIGAQMAVEAGEEAAGEAVGLLYDWIAMGDSGDLKKTMDAYKAEHGEEGAGAELALQILLRLGMAATSGALSGLALGGGAQMLNLLTETGRNAADLSPAMEDDGVSVDPSKLAVEEAFDPEAISYAEETKTPENGQNEAAATEEPTSRVEELEQKRESVLDEAAQLEAKESKTDEEAAKLENLYEEAGLLQEEIEDVQAVEAHPNAIYNERDGDNGWGDAFDTSLEAVRAAMREVDGKLWNLIATEEVGVKNLGRFWDTPVTDAMVAVASNVEQGWLTPYQAAKVLSDTYRKQGESGLGKLYSGGQITAAAVEQAKGYTKPVVSASAAANADKQSIGAKKAAFQYEEAPSKQKSTESALEPLTDFEMGELDTAFPAQETKHQKVSVKQNEELARQRIEADFEGEKSDLTKKESWNAEDIATAQAVLMKLREDWRNEKEASKRTAAREAFNNWYDVVAEHKSVVAQAMRQMQEYVAKMAADDPKTALEVIQHELDKVNARGKSEFGDKWRDIKLTDEEKYRIDSLAPGDTKAYLEIVDDIGKRIQEEYPAKLREKIRELSRINMLLNVRTLLKNPLANLFLQGVSRTSAKVSALAQNAIHAFDKDYEPTQAFVISKKSKDLAKAVWDEIGETVVEKGQKYDPNATPKEDGLLLKRVPKKEVFKKTVIDRKLPFLGKAAEGAAGFLNKLSKRMTGAELFVEMTDEKSMLENTRQLTYGLLELGDRGFMRSSFIYRLSSYCEAMGIDSVEDIPEDAYRLAIESAFMDTFKDDNWATELTQGLKKALDKAAGAGEILMPFTKTPANVTKRSIEYSPAGLVASTIKAIAKGRTAAKGGDINNGRELSRTIDMMAKGLTGSALMVVGMVMYNAGRITGGTPEDKDEAAFLEQAGWKPFSFVTKGGKYISFDWAQPAAMTLILGASAADNWGRGGGKGLLEHANDFAIVFFDTIFEQSTLQELEKLFGGYGSTGENVVDVVLNYPTRFISSGLYAAAKVVDPVKRETYEKSSGAATLLNKMQSEIPGLSKKLPEKYDIWGNVVKRDETYGEAFINAYFNPGTVTQYKETPANDEILRLYEATLDSSVFPMATDRKVEMDVDGKRVEVQCDNEQFSNLCKNTGKARASLMNAALDSAWYKGLTNDEKVKFLYKMWSLAKVAGKVKTFPDGEIPGAQDNEVYDVYARDGAASVLRYYQIKDEANTDGNTNLSQKETLLYLKGQNWDSAEKGKWLGTLVTGKDSDTQKVKAKYGDSAMGSWYDYYSVLYADAERHREENGLKTVNVGATDQIDMAKALLANLEASEEQKAYYWEITGDSKTWKEENPYK